MLWVYLKRLIELVKFIKIAQIRHENVRDVLVDLAGECKHLNEFAWACMQMGTWYAKDNMPDRLSDLMRKLKGE